MANNITETGPVGLRGIRNTDLYGKLSSLSQEGNENAKALLSSLSSKASRPFDNASSTEGYFEPVQNEAGSPWSDFGNSQYDESYISGNEPTDINEHRYENQPWYDTLANGVGKMLGTAGTTFLSSLVGLPYGLAKSAVTGEGSALWNNEITEELANADKWLEENMTNYKSQKQQNAAWYNPENLFSMNFIADDVIKNMGFTLGAAASMAVGSGSLGLLSKAFGLADKIGKTGKVASNVLSALYSATGEGMIEARQGVEERNKLEFQKLDDTLAPEYNALNEEEAYANQEYALTGDYNTYSRKMQDIVDRKQILDARKEAGRQQIEESGLEMGNKILLANQALLTAGNLIQFSKGMTKSFDKARHAAEMSEKYAKPFGVGITRVGKNIAEGYKLTGKNLGRAVAATKGLVTEGSEEMNQQWIQSGAGAYYNEKDVNDYWKAKLDPEAYRETTKGLYTLGNAISQGFNESWGDLDQWEQFAIGAFTGMAGSYMPSKIFNQDKSKSRWNPARYGSWEGGAYNELQDFNKEYNRAQENVDDLNAILAQEDFPARVRSMVGHTYMETQKEEFVNKDNMKAWKDADDKQNIMDIQAFIRAGKLDDLRAIYDEMGKNLSDDDIENIVKSTTQERVDEETGQKYYIGAFVDDKGNRTATNDEIREEIQHNADEMNRKLNSYLDSIDAVNKDTKGALTKDQEDNLAYLHNMSKESLVRADKIIAEKRKQMPSVFLMKTDKTPEQLAKEYASSDLAFSKDENTKEGYVEVDTSAMDDRSFRNFFIGELLWGGNINPEFAETADEKALREEEEKNLPEAERKKRARERISKKWKDALEKQEKDAKEQRNTNSDLLTQHFIDNYKKNNNFTQGELQSALNDFFQDIIDAAQLVTQSGEYDKKLREYMNNPSLVDKDKEKEETKAQKAEEEKQAKDKFEGKSARQMNQEIANGTLNSDEVDDWGADADISGVSADDARNQSKQEAKKSQEIRQKANSLKQHIQEQLGENPTAEEISLASKAMQKIDNAAMEAEDVEGISLDSPQILTPVLDENENLGEASIADVEKENEDVISMIAEAMNAFKEDKNAHEDIPEQVPTINDVETPETSGKDPVVSLNAEVPVPDVQKPTKNSPDIVPKNPLTEGALNTIISEVQKLYDRPSVNGAWRSTTTRNVYGKSIGTYHEDYAKKQFGEDSKEYKRSKAIWEYLNSEGAFDRMDNASQDRIKEGDVIHFKVRYLPEVFSSRIEEVSDEDKPYAMVILMMNANGEVLGDLPLAQLEPSFKAGNPNDQVKVLQQLQDKIFDAFYKMHERLGGNEAVVDSVLHISDIPNLNLVFDNNKKTPLVAKVKQVMKGVVPFSENETNTLNDVAGSSSLFLGIRTQNGMAYKRGDTGTNKDINIPGVGSTGQPYMVLPTASGTPIAVPFYTPFFDAGIHKNTELYKHLVNALYYLMRDYNNAKANLDNFGKHIDVIEGLLQVKRPEKERVIEVSKDNVTLHLKSLTDPNADIIRSVPNTGNTTDVAIALAETLSGLPINVSLQFLNSEIETGNSQGGIRKSDYNRVIGEVANINLPVNTAHTVNTWFTVDLAPSASVQKSNRITPKTTGVITVNVNGRNIDIDADRYIAYDPETGEILSGNEDINLILAQTKAAKPQYQGKDRIQITIDGKTRTYDVKEGKFLSTPSVAVTTPVKESTEEEKQANAELPSNAVSLEQPETTSTPNIQDKTIEQIEEEVKKNKIIGRQNKDAWEAMPDDLKLKLFNEGIPVILSYNNKNVTISSDNLSMMSKALQDANMAAKANNLSFSEAAKPMEKDGSTIEKEKEREAKRWLAKNLPSLSSEERTQFTDRILRMGDDANKYWGCYRSGVIEIQNNAPMGTVYHEAFHYVLDMILSPEERKSIMDIAKEEYGISDNWTAEERLANDFRKYAMDENATGIIGKLKRWFRRLMDKINRYNRISDITVNQLFWKINNGGFAQKSKEVESFEENRQRVLREIRNIQIDKYTWNNLSPEIKEALKDSGISKTAYEEMSLEEKEQFVKCRG